MWWRLQILWEHTRSKFQIILIIVGLMGLAHGGQDLIVIMSNQAPAQMTCAQFANSTSIAKWVELSDCRIDYANAIQLENAETKVDGGTFFPVAPFGQSGPAPFLLEMKSADAASRLAKRSPTEPPKPETISGIFKFGMTSDSRVRSALNPLLVKNATVASDYRIIESGATPQQKLPAAIGFSVGGPLVAILGFLWFRRSRTREATAVAV